MTQLQTNKWQKVIFNILLLLCVGSLALTVFLIYHFYHNKTQMEQEAFDNAKRQASFAADQISQRFDEFVTLTDAFANDLTDGTLPYEAVEDRLCHDIEANPDLLGLGLGFAPYAYDPEVRLYAPYYLKDEHGNFQKGRIEEDFGEYVDPKPTTKWYHDSLTKGPGWQEPWVGAAYDGLITTYGVPFYRTDPTSSEKVPAGAVFVTLSLDDVDRLIDSLDLGATGYGYVLSKEGLFNAHPIKELVGHTTIFDLAEAFHGEELQTIGERAIRGETFSFETVDKVTGKSSWIFQQPIPANGWSVGIVLNKEEFSSDVETTRQQLISIALALMAFLFFLSTLLFRVDRGHIRCLWAASISFSVLCVLTIAWMWYLASFVSGDLGVKIVDKAGLNSFLTSYTQRTNTPDSTPPIYIPTGVFIQTMRFPAPNEVALSGYIWQKYSPDIDAEISRGFVVPQQAEAEYVIEEAFRRQIGGVEIIGWNFKLTLRQPFKTSKYPFDNRDVLLRLWHEDFDKNVILTPDLDAYDLIAPDLLPGLDDELVLKGWQIKQSVFSYRTHNYNTNFGLDDFVGQQDVPEFYFNVELRRNFLDSFIAYLVPLIVIAIMMFAILLVPNEHTEQEVFGVLSFIAALFFVVIVAHIGLRGDITAEGVTYIEYFYIVMYVAMLVVSGLSIFFSSRLGFHLIQYRDNLISKLLYWPVILGTSLGITLLIL